MSLLATITSLLSQVFVFVIPSIMMLIQSILYFKSLKPTPPRTNTSTNLDKRPLVSVLVVFKDEPTELIERFITGISKIKWPRKSLEIIMVSDDPPHIASKIKNIVLLRGRELGLNVRFFSRIKPIGGKAGALNYGLKHCGGKYVLTMDIDSIIDANFVEEAVKVLESKPNVAAVVGRWAALNRDSRIAEGIAHAMEFIIDSTFKAWHRLGIPVYTLGTGTLYRRKVLEEVNGWSEDMLMDDLEIGARIINAGYHVDYMDNVKVYVEVPPTLRAYRIQQYKWSYGAMELLRKRTKHILTSPIPYHGRFLLLLYPLQYLPLITTLIGIPILGILSLLLETDILCEQITLACIWVIALIVNGIAFNHCLKVRGISGYKSLVLSGRNTGLLISQTPYILISSLKGLLGLSIKRRVTPKGEHAKKIHEKTVPLEIIVLIIMLILAILVMLKGILYTSLFIFVYALSYLYALYRWHNEILQR